MAVPRHAPERSDAELLDAARLGSSDAFFEVWERHAEFAQRYANTMTHNVHDADDLVADVRDRVWRAIANGKGPTVGVRSYIATALRNRAATNAQAPTLVDLDEADDMPSESAAVSDRVADEAIMDAALRSLPERTREIILLTQVSQVSTEQLAIHFGTTRNNASQITRRALDRLRNAWIDAHMAVDTGAGPACVACRSHIRRLVAGDASPEEAAAVQAHIDGDDGCERCRAAYAGAMDSGRYRALMIPAFLGSGVTAEWLAGGGSSAMVTGRSIRGWSSRVLVGGAVGILVVAVVLSALALVGGDSSVDPDLAVDEPAQPRRVEDTADDRDRDRDVGVDSGTDTERRDDGSPSESVGPVASSELASGPGGVAPVDQAPPADPAPTSPPPPTTEVIVPPRPPVPPPAPGGAGSFARTETFTGRWDMVTASAAFAVGDAGSCDDVDGASTTVSVAYPVTRPTATRNILTWTGSGVPDTDVVVNGQPVSASIVDSTGVYSVNGVSMSYWQATLEVPRAAGDVYVVEGLSTEMDPAQCAMGAVVANVSILSLFEHPSNPDRIVTMASGLVPMHSSITTESTTTPSPTGRVVEVFATVLEGDEFGAGESISLGSTRLDDGSGIWKPSESGQASTGRWTLSAPTPPADIRLTSGDDHVLATVVIVVSERER